MAESGGIFYGVKELRFNYCCQYSIDDHNMHIHVCNYSEIQYSSLFNLILTFLWTMDKNLQQCPSPAISDQQSRDDTRWHLTLMRREKTTMFGPIWSYKLVISLRDTKTTERNDYSSSFYSVKSTCYSS